MDRFFKSPQVALAALAGAEPSVCLSQELHGLPIQGLHKIGITGFIAVAQVVFTRRSSPFYAGQPGGVHTQSVAHIIETVGTRQMSIEHRDQVAPLRIAPCVEPVLDTQRIENGTGNEIANLT